MKVKYPYPVRQTELQNKIAISYIDEGEDGNYTFLFIHGLAGYIPIWKFQIDEFSKKFRCLAVDLPGNGMSPAGDYPYSVFFYAETLVRFIEKLQLKNVILCGHSMGGHISMILALRYPSLFKKIILIAPSGLETFSEAERLGMNNLMHFGNLFFSGYSQLEPTINQSFYKKNQYAGEMVNELKELINIGSVSAWNKMTMQLVRSMLNEQVGGFIKELQVPVLILFGKKDELIPNRFVHPYLTLDSILTNALNTIKDSEGEIIPAAGHFVQIEQYSIVNDRISGFINR